MLGMGRGEQGSDQSRKEGVSQRKPHVGQFDCSVAEVRWSGVPSPRSSAAPVKFSNELSL